MSVALIQQSIKQSNIDGYIPFFSRRVCKAAEIWVVHLHLIFAMCNRMQVSLMFILRLWSARIP